MWLLGAGHRFCLFWGGYWLGWRDRTEQAEVDGFVREIRALAEKGGKAMSNTGAQSTQEVFRERAYKSADLAAKLYDADADIRLDMLPVIGIDDWSSLSNSAKGQCVMAI